MGRCKALKLGKWGDFPEHSSGAIGLMHPLFWGSSALAQPPVGAEIVA